MNNVPRMDDKDAARICVLLLDDVSFPNPPPGGEAVADVLEGEPK